MALRAWLLQNVCAHDSGSDRTVDVEEQHRLFGIERVWLNFLAFDQFEIRRLCSTVAMVEADRKERTVYPPSDDVHRWSRLCAPDQVRVVIIGQDPYHEGSASGLAFGTVPGGKIPPSLLNIYKEMHRTIQGFQMPNSGFLDPLCSEGVLLLNSVFTVIQGQPGSHETYGWQVLCDRAISQLSRRTEHLVFMLWGRSAQEKEYLIDNNRHLVLKSSHPSPRVRLSKTPLIGNDHFVKANRYLTQHGKPPVDWTVLNTAS